MLEKTKRIDELKLQLDKLRPLQPIELKQLKQYYKIGLTYSSNAIEGNTLTESETKVLLEDGLTTGGKPMVFHLEAKGHSDAFDFIYDIINKKDIEESDILKLHQLFYYRIDDKNAGSYRQNKVFISGSDFIPPSPKEIAAKMTQFFKNLRTSQKEEHPVISAALAHKEFVTIHPFIDGNGRTARLLMNLMLIKEGYPIVIMPPILRTEYINALQSSNKGNDEPFLELILNATIEALKDYLRKMK